MHIHYVDTDITVIKDIKNMMTYENRAKFHANRRKYHPTIL